ncbi:ribonuclease H-like domain-containing protein [Tanacetum coccineum]|uniref:Ribonuclease H-like domain-containing protein n=1 Tax=Tanacetum coccineum TaxID=301880 RepID=A0ABQ5ICL5_9ASTR
MMLKKNQGEQHQYQQYKANIKFKREQRIARERAAEQEAKDAALIAKFDNVQERMEANALLAAILQEEEREQFSINGQARFLVETIAERKSHASDYLSCRGPYLGCDRLVSRAKVIENQVMAIFVISISSDSSEQSVGTSTARVIFFGTILTDIPATVPLIDPPIIHDDTLLIPVETPTIPPIAPTLPHTSLFLDTDSSDSDSFDRPASPDSHQSVVARWRSKAALHSSSIETLPPTYDLPPADATQPIHQILPAPPGLSSRPAVLVLPGQPIPFGRPYRTQPNGVRKMLMTRKRDGPLPSHRLALRYLEDHSSSDNFSSDDSLDSSSDSSGTSSGHSLSDTSFDTPAAASARPSCKRCRTPVILVSLVLGIIEFYNLVLLKELNTASFRKNGNYFQPVPRTTTNADGTSTSTIPSPVNIEEKVQKKNNVKARSMLLMELPKHLLIFSQYKDAKTLFEAIQARFGIVEQEVKRTVSSSSNLSSQNMAFVSSLSSTNEVNTPNIQVSTASTPVTTASLHDNTPNLNDATVYAFLANQPNGSQLVHEDLEQIHEDDLEEIDLKWQLALLSMRARRYYQRTGKKITINGSDTASYDMTKVECFNCHKMGHFARECRSPRYQESRPTNQDSSRKTVNVEETSSKAMVAIDGAGFDWSFMADEEVPTNMALMAFSDSEFNKSEFDLANYKRGLAFVEEQLVFYKKNEIENLKKEKESNKIKIDNFENASKSLDKLIVSQIPDNSKKGLGYESYHVVAPPPTGLFAPPAIDLSNSGLEEFQQPEFEGYGLKVNKSVSEYSSNETKKLLVPQ